MQVRAWDRRMLHSGRRHARDKEPGAVLGAKIGVRGTSKRGWQESGKSREGPRAAAWTPPMGHWERSPSGAGDLQVAPPVPSNSPQEWSGTSFLRQYPSKRSDCLMAFETTNHINQKLKSQTSSKGEIYI